VTLVAGGVESVHLLSEHGQLREVGGRSIQGRQLCGSGPLQTSELLGVGRRQAGIGVREQQLVGTGSLNERNRRLLGQRHDHAVSLFIFL